MWDRVPGLYRDTYTRETGWGWRSRSGTPRVSRYLHRPDRGNNNRSQSPGSDAKPPSDYRGCYCCRVRWKPYPAHTYIHTHVLSHTHTSAHKSTDPPSGSLHVHTCIRAACMYMYVIPGGLNRGTKKMFGQCHTAQAGTALREDALLCMLRGAYVRASIVRAGERLDCCAYDKRAEAI